MTLLNISLCLPELDIVALCQKQSIVVITKRFMVPDKSFALLPCRDLPDSMTLENLYQPHALAQFKAAVPDNSGLTKLTHWAQCFFCQQLVDESAIATLGDRIIWPAAALMDYLASGDRLFLSFLRVYELPTAIEPKTQPSSEQLYRFVPLPGYIESSTHKPVFSDADFSTAKETLLQPASPEPNLSDLDKDSDDSNQTPESLPEIKENILDSSDWASKIAEIGNSSDGHTFEKLVRKGLMALGFSNSQNNAAMSLDPTATGGAGGLDFYADQPYPIVGECKATSTETVRSNATAQLIVLGMRHLSNAYQDCIKLVVAAGNITTHAHRIAEEHSINVIRPETLQALVELQLKYENYSVDIHDLKFYLERPPFSIATDDQVKAFIQECEKEIGKREWYLQQRRQIMGTVQELSNQPIHRSRTAFTAVEIRAHHNAKYEPCVTDEAMQDMLTELSSPLCGNLARRNLPGESERFSFVKDIPGE